MKVTNIKNKVINIGASMVLPDESIEISDDYRNNGVIRKLEKMGFIKIEEESPEDDSADAGGTEDEAAGLAAEKEAAEKAAAEEEAKKKAAAEKKAAKKAAATEKATTESAATEEASTEK